MTNTTPNLFSNDRSALTDTEQLLINLYYDRRNLETALEQARLAIPRTKKGKRIRTMAKIHLKKLHKFTPEQASEISHIEGKVIKGLQSEILKTDLDPSPLASFFNWEKD
jgi:hypothetical protein